MISEVEPRNVNEALDENWVQTMREELEPFKKNEVWTLVNPSKNKVVIRAK